MKSFFVHAMGCILSSLFLSLPVFALEVASGTPVVTMPTGNPYLPLCQEFKAYLQRNHAKQLHCGLVPDPEFKEFRLPVYKLAPEGLGLRLMLQAATVQSEYSRKKRPLYEAGYRKRFKQVFENHTQSRYRITRLDINHDGTIDNVIYKDQPETCLTTGSARQVILPYTENLNIDSSFIGFYGYKPRSSGEPFLYKGRVYWVYGSGRVRKGVYHIYEPTYASPYGELIKLFVPRSICDYYIN